MEIVIKLKICKTDLIKWVGHVVGFGVWKVESFHLPSIDRNVCVCRDWVLFYVIWIILDSEAIGVELSLLSTGDGILTYVQKHELWNIVCRMNKLNINLVNSFCEHHFGHTRVDMHMLPIVDHQLSI